MTEKHRRQSVIDVTAKCYTKTSHTRAILPHMRSSFTMALETSYFAQLLHRFTLTESTSHQFLEDFILIIKWIVIGNWAVLGGFPLQSPY